MTDVIQIAQERRAQLRAELQKLEEFLRMAEMLTRDTDGRDLSPEIAKVPERTTERLSQSGDADSEKTAGPSALRTNLFRQSGTGA